MVGVMKVRSHCISFVAFSTFFFFFCFPFSASSELLFFVLYCICISFYFELNWELVLISGIFIDWGRGKDFTRTAPSIKWDLAALGFWTFSFSLCRFKMLKTLYLPPPKLQAIIMYHFTVNRTFFPPCKLFQLYGLSTNIILHVVIATLYLWTENQYIRWF